MVELFKQGSVLQQCFGNKNPVIGGKVEKDFYARPPANSPEGHNGEDYTNKAKGDVEVILPCDVTRIIYAAPDYSNGFGAYVQAEFIGLDGKTYHLYIAHLDSWRDELLTMEGVIPKGTVVGIMGGSGNGLRHAFASHVHFGIRGLDTPRNNGYNGYLNPKGIIYK